MTLEITEEWDGETLWKQEDLLAFAPILAQAEEMEEEEDEEEDCECEDECECEEPEEKESDGKKSCAKCGKIIKAGLNQVKCKSCGVDINYNEIPEKSMGSIACPSCKKLLDQEGNVLPVIGSIHQGYVNILSDLKKFEEFLATASKQTVMNSETLHTETNMLTSFADINEEYLKTAQANELREFLEKQVAESAAKASEQLKAEKASVEAEKASVAAELEAAKKELADAKAQLDVIVAEKALAAAQELFSKRMGYFDEKFELAKEDKEIIAKDLKEVKDDEVFASYQKKMDTLLKGKEKGKQAVASTVVVDEQKIVEKALDNAVAEVVTVTAGSAPKDEPKSLLEKFRKHFALNDENFKKR